MINKKTQEAYERGYQDAKDLYGGELVPELLDALEGLLAYSNKYSDAMREYGRGADQLGTDATQPYYIAEIARKTIAKTKGTL